MLSQAIIDVQTLREVAMKNAENVIMEKYADKIKEAVELILEQDEEDLDTDTELETGLEDIEDDEGGKESSVTEDVPMAAVSGERLCQCPEEDEEIEIDFDDLQQQMEQEPEASQETVAASPLPLSSTESEEEYELKEEDLANFLKEFEIKEETTEQVSETEEEDEQVNEVLTVDVKPVKSGWKDVSGSKTELNTDMALAKAQDSEEQEKIAKLMKAKEEVQTELNESTKKIFLLKETSNKNKRLLSEAYKIINELLLTNTKLFYTNCVYRDNSLNERQKDNIADNLSKVNTVEEAKVVFKSLKSTMGVSSGPAKTLKESLSETINKPSGLMLQGKRVLKEQISNAAVNQVSRMQVLAGIKKGGEKGN